MAEKVGQGIYINGIQYATMQDATETSAGLMSISDKETATSLSSVTFLSSDGAAYHNAIYGSRYLGDKVTDAQWAVIKDGSFEGLYVGDYWTIEGFDWICADFNYWSDCGNSGLAVSDNHIVIIPSTFLYYDTYMNPTNTTEGGYVGSYMYQEGLDKAKEMISEIFGDHLLVHSTYLCNATTNGYPSAGAWYDEETVDLMTEEMVYGSCICQQMSHAGTLVHNGTIDKQQLSVFKFNRKLQIARGNGTNGYSSSSRYYWWLRDVASSTYFANVNNNGCAYAGTASNAYGVRPCFGIF